MFLRFLRTVLILGALVYLFFFGGPAMGVVIASWSFALPAFFVGALLLLAIWKIRDLVRH